MRQNSAWVKSVLCPKEDFAADAENSNKGDAEEAKRADDELPEPLLSSPVENKTLNQLDMALYMEDSMPEGSEIGTLSRAFEHLQASEVIINIR